MRICAALSFAFLLAALISPASAAEPTFAQRFAGVKQWEFHYVYTSSSPHSWEEGGVQHRRSVWTQSSSGRIPLKTLHSDSQTVQMEGRAPAISSYNKEKSESIWATHETRYDRGTGTGEAYVEVNLYLDEGTYDIYIAPGNIPVTYGGTYRDAHESRSYGPNTYELEVNVPTPAPAELVLKLPESGRMISGTWSWEQYHAKQPQSRIGGEYNLDEVYRATPASGTVRWFLVPGDPLEVELIVEPQNYDAWIPRGALDEGKAGNTIAIKAKLVAKGGGGPPPVKARTMTFTLLDTSREKGVALNWPVAGAGNAPDLAFEAEKNSDATIGGEGQSLVTAEGSLEEATALLSSFDFGGYTTVLVTAQLEDGRAVVGRLQGGESSDVLIPKRTSTSMIADAWKAAVGFSGADTDDNDEQPGNEHKGDGLTAYQEYRGLIALGAHTRDRQPLDPKKKKSLVVINHLGDAARPGLKLFSQASGIDAIELKPAEAPETRLVTVNSTYGHGGDQFGIKLAGEDLGGAIAGVNRPADVYRKTPKLSEVAVVDLAFIGEQYAGQSAIAKAAGLPMPYTLQEDIDNTVAHEVAHGIGAPHHGKETEWFGKREITDRMVDYHAYGIDGIEVAHPKPGDKPLEIKGMIGRPGNDASGDTGCIMCYTNYYQWAVIGPESGPYSFYAVAPQPVGKTFCTSPAGTGMNAPRTLPDGKTIPGFFGDAKGQGGGAPVGNCLGAMRVRDW